MTPYPQSIINALRAGLQELRASHEKTIQSFVEKWRMEERKHERSLRESTSDAWTNSLENLYAERKSKNDDAKSQLLAELERLPTPDELDAHEIEAALTAVDEEISKYRGTLSIRRRQTEFTGDYGEIDNEKWIKEIVRFIDRNPRIGQLLDQLRYISLKLGLTMDWPSVIEQRVNDSILPATSLPDVAPSDGGSFEHACLLALHNSGWSAALTPPSGDQGVDILAKKNDISVAIQCKNYSAPVGNGAVQEVHAGKSFYEADVAVVISRSGYTPSASLLAKKLRVLLLDQASLGSLEDLL